MENVHRIVLKDGVSAVVDVADADLVAGFNWRLSSNGYVYADRGYWRIALHRLIAGPKESEQVDHHNGDPLDNRSINLRVCTPGQNQANRIAVNGRPRRSSDYRGVSWDSAKKTWKAYVHVNGKTRALGNFLDEVGAARAYDAAAKEAWGEFARLNNV
jgi:hypothetical protein